MKVPALTIATFSGSPVVGSTTAAMADRPKATDPARLTAPPPDGAWPLHAGRETACKSEGDSTRSQEGNRAKQIRCPDQAILLLHGQIGDEGSAGADVEEERPYRLVADAVASGVRLRKARNRRCPALLMDR